MFLASDAATGYASVSVTVPDQVLPGDQLVLFVSADRYLGGVALVTPPTGWTEVSRVQAGSTNLSIVFSRIATVSDANSAVVTEFTALACGAILRAYRDERLQPGAAWVSGAPAEMPVSLEAGEAFSAFVFSSGPASHSNPDPAKFGIYDPDGRFPTEDYLSPTLPSSVREFSMATLTGVAPTAVPTVKAQADDPGTGFQLTVWAWVARSVSYYTPRIRSHVSEDAGSLFQATQAVAVELGISEAFPFASDVPAGVLRAFHEAFTPDDVAIRYYPLPTRNQEMLVTVDGETNLGRMARVYPEALMLPAASIPGESGGVVTAQQAVQHVLDSWESAHPWLVFEPVPDLRILEPGAASDPRQYYIDNASAGILTTAAVVIPQDGTDRRSMRDILDEWLAIFPGTIVRQTSGGTIELVPRVGPDAPEDPAVTLTWRDLIAISEGDPDPRGVINRARVTSQGWEFTDNQTLRPPAFVVSIGGLGIQRSVLDGEEVIPDDSEEFQPWRTIPFTVLVDGGNSVTVNVSIAAFGSWSRTTASAFSTEGTASPSVTLAVGQSAEVSITHTSRALSVTARWRLTRVSSVAIDVEPVSVPSYAENLLGRTYLAYLLEFDISGTAWVRSNESVTSEFGQDGVGIPADGGGDAIANSRAQYGERLAQLQSNIFQLTPEQAQAIAQSYVLWNINPRTVRDVQQSEWARYPVKFDHVGRYVDLPTGERAVIENRSYSDSFSSTHGAMASSFSASVTEIVIDTSTDWLLLDSGDFFQLDSGDLVEVS